MPKPSLLDVLIAVAVIAALIWVANWDPLGSKAGLKSEAQTATRQATYERSAGKIEAQRSINTQSIIRHTEEGKRLVAESHTLQDSMDQFSATARELLNDADQPTDPDEKRHDPGG